MLALPTDHPRPAVSSSRGASRGLHLSEELSAGVVEGEMIEPALNLTAKGGTLVVTGLAPMLKNDVQMNLFMLSMMNKEVKGTIFGSANPRAQIPNLLSMYREGTLKLDELVTKRYTLDEVNQGYEDMRAGTNIRGVIEL